MTGQATRRLIDAAATLDPADRALLNLWVHRGLGDARVATLTGMTADAVRGRRERIVALLGAELGLPETEVTQALAALDPAGPAHAVAAVEASPGPAGEPEAPGVQPEAPGVEPDTPASERETPAIEAEAPAVAAGEGTAAPQDDRPRRRARVWMGLTGAAAAIVAVLLIALLSGGHSARRTADVSDPPPPTAATTTTSTATTSTATQPTSAGRTTSAPAPSSTPAATTGAATTHHASGGAHGAHIQAFVELPGGLRHASGTVTLIRHGHRLSLRLTVKGLPHLRYGRYEAWLYDTVLSSRALGRVRSRATETFPLGAGGRSYASIDISYQPPGSRTESGESRLRAVNPAHELPSLKKRRTPTRARRHHASSRRTHRRRRRGARRARRTHARRHATHHPRRTRRSRRHA